MRPLSTLYAAVFVGGFVVGALGVMAQSNPGQAAFEKRCGGCHGVDSAKEGPALRRVFGRHAGKQPAFPYSDALKSASFDWDRRSLDRWLIDPDSVVPGTDMAFRLTDKNERDQIISYLEQLK